MQGARGDKRAEFAHRRVFQKTSMSSVAAREHDAPAARGRVPRQVYRVAAADL
jgi:hypothetical protein